jgi:glutamine amidotransferase
VTIAVIDMEVSNVGSVANMLRRIGAGAQVTASPDDVEAADRILLPGVGSFDVAMAQLHRSGLDGVLRRAAARGIPILGVCLGMQLLADASEEGALPGLGLIPGRVRRLPAEIGDVRYPVPHMGWNTVAVTKSTVLDLVGEAGRRYYFVHSYAFACEDPDDQVGVTRYGAEFTSAVARANVMGVQFHPEKSHRHGMDLLTAWSAV